MRIEPCLMTNDLSSGQSSVIQKLMMKSVGFLFFLSIGVYSSTLLGQASATENWSGVLDVGTVKLRIQLKLTPGTGGKLSGEMVSPDQSPVGIKLDKVTRSNDKLEFEIRRIGVSYKGKLNDDQTVATGTFTQGQEYDVVFKRVAETKPDKHIQTWKGTMKAGGKEFDFQFRIFRGSQGEKLAKLDSFSESLMNIPGDYRLDGKEVTIEIPMTKAKFVGVLNEEGNAIDGNWLQSGGKFPLNLAEVPLEQTRSLDLKRPQTPQPPFDYDSSDFSVSAKSVDSSFDADVVLAGTMTSPKGAGPFPTVILISGSGPQDRNETIFEHRPFWVLADHLTKKGFVVIRFDDRGVAESTGDLVNSTSADFANDVEVVMAWAKDQSKVDARKIVLLGHSEGGLIAPMVAIRSDDVAGIILMAGPGVPGSQIVMNQTRKIAAAAGMPENILKMQDEMLRSVMTRLDSGGAFDKSFKSELKAKFSGLSEQQRAEFGIDDVAEKTAGVFNSPWMMFFLKHDPRPLLSKTTCPILSVIGEKDLQVDPGLNLPAIEAAVKLGGNKDFVQKELPGLNHLFQKSETGSPSEYITIEETLHQSFLDEVTNWLQERFK